MKDEFDLIHLIYVSTAVDEFSEQDLSDIISSSVKNNEMINITGILVFNKGKLMQFLEGSEFNVMKLFKTIKKDYRHHGIDLVRKQKIPHRQYEDWKMRMTFPEEILEDSGIIYEKLFLNSDMSDTNIDLATESHAWLLAFKNAN